MGLKEYMNQLENEMVLRIPFLFDEEDGGKNIIHKCAQARSTLIMESVVDTYSDRAFKIHIDKYVNEGGDTKNPDIQRVVRWQIKRNVQDWVNEKTQCQNEFRAIHFACYQGDSDFIRLLCKYGAQVDIRNKMGLSPMHVAA